MKFGDYAKQFFLSSPMALAVLMTCAVFLSELIIMLVLPAALQGTPAPVIALLNALLLVLLVLPLIWLYVVRPLKRAALREKARADELLAQSSLDWEDTFNTITDMITVHDKDFTVIRANRAAREALNLPEEALGRAKCFHHYHGVDSPPRDCPSCRSLVTGEPVASETFEQHLNRHVEIRAIPRFGSDRSIIGLTHIVRDITARKRMEALLENQKRFAENLIQNSAVATFVLDPQHRVVIWNKACEELTGIPASEMIGTSDHWKPFYDRQRPTLADIVIDGSYDRLSTLYGKFERSSLVSNGVHAQGWYLNMNGKNRYIIFDAAPIMSSEGDLLVAIETLQDVPERGRMEEELAWSESKLRTLIEAEQDCVMVVAEDGTLLEMNPAGLRMIDAGKPEQAAGKTLYALVLPEYAGRARALTEQVFRGVPGHLEFEFAGLNGAHRWVETRAVPLRSAQGEIRAMLAVARDITVQKRLENQLRHAQKMEAVGTLTGGIAHDFNNILTSIIGYGELLRMTRRLDVQWEDYLDQLLASADRAANLTKNLLAFSRKQIMAPKRVDINKVIRRVEKLLSRLIGEDIELTTGLAERELAAQADIGQIEQVLVNLAVNARDAMPGGGALSLTTGTFTIDDEYVRTRQYGQPGLYVRICVSDTGTGMDEETRMRIFEPYFTTKEVGKGTGLGLSIVYGIITQHNGYIDCDSEPGRGSTFAIYLPLAGEKAEEMNVSAYQDSFGGSESVLVAEDDPAVRRLTRTMLEQLGYTVLEASNGEEAVSLFKEQGSTVDLVMLDVIMPKMNGKQVRDEIRNIRPDIKTLFTSGYTADVISSKGMLEEGIQLLQKPVTLRELSEKVRAVLDSA